MTKTKFEYSFTCINCNVKFFLEYKDEQIQKATCPVCEKKDNVPIKVVEITIVSSTESE